MSDFIEPKKVFVSEKEYIEKLLNLEKDLHGNEELCEFCHGTGIAIADNVYGLRNEGDKGYIRFPYKHQALTFCPHCYNGVVHRCEFCGNILPRGYLKCTCDKQKEIDEQEIINKYQDMLDKAPELPDGEWVKYDMLFSESYGLNNGYFNDFDEFFDYWSSEDCDNEYGIENRPKYVWVTEAVEMYIDADSIIDSACEELYEDAADDISTHDRGILQKLLDDWCKTHGVGKTYYESHKYKIRIPWEENDRV